MSISMLKKLVSGDSRKTRLHDEKGHRISWSRLFRHAPPAIATGLARLAFGYRPALPWISYDAIEALKAHLNPQSRVLEFGSGMSTIWYAAHAGEVCSVDDYRPWYDKVKAQFEKRGLKNVRYEFAETAEAYYGFMKDDPLGFDLIMVDGSYRDLCVESAKHLLKPGGLLYLDNSDKDSTPDGGPVRRADNLAITFAKERGAEIAYFTDFAPTQLFVQEGLLVKLPT